MKPDFETISRFCYERFVELCNEDDDFNESVFGAFANIDEAYRIDVLEEKEREDVHIRAFNKLYNYDNELFYRDMPACLESWNIQQQLVRNRRG